MTIKDRLHANYLRGFRAAVSGTKINTRHLDEADVVDSAFAAGYRSGQAQIEIAEHSARRFAEKQVRNAG